MTFFPRCNSFCLHVGGLTDCYKIVFSFWVLLLFSELRQRCQILKIVQCANIVQDILQLYSVVASFVCAKFGCSGSMHKFSMFNMLHYNDRILVR